MKAPKNNLCRAAAFELRADRAGDGFTLEGYGAVFDSPTRIDSWEGTFDEVLARGAFAKTIKERTPVLQFDHGRDPATGSVPIGNVESLSEDAHGLLVRARLHDNARVEPIRQAIASGAVDGMSFRFRVVKEEWTAKDARTDGVADAELRTIREVELFELGPVVFPAYASTTVGVRSLLADLDDEERARLVADLAREIAPLPLSNGTFVLASNGATSNTFTTGYLATNLTGAAVTGTPTATREAADPGTSGPSNGERAAFLRTLELRELKK